MAVEHEWYGPCDALGPNGECVECMKVEEASMRPVCPECGNAMRQTHRLSAQCVGCHRRYLFTEETAS